MIYVQGKRGVFAVFPNKNGKYPRRSRLKKMIRRETKKYYARIDRINELIRDNDMILERLNNAESL